MARLTAYHDAQAAKLRLLARLPCIVSTRSHVLRC